MKPGMPAARPVVAVALAAAVGLSAPAGAVDLGDGIVHLRAGAWRVAEGPAHAERPGGPGPAGRAPAGDLVETWLVAADGPATPELRGLLESAGRRIVGYVPSNAFLVRGPAGAAGDLAGAPGIARVEPYRAAWKVDPELDRDGIGLLLHVEVFAGEDPAAVADEAARRGAVVVAIRDTELVRRVLVRADGSQVDGLAEVSGVEWIEERGVLTLRNDVVRWVIQSNLPDSTPLYDRGLLGAGQIVGHIDGSIDTSSCFFRDPDHPIGPDHRKLVAWRFDSGNLANAHGTHTAGTLAGENVDLAFPQHRGMAPKARISHQDWEALNGDEWNGEPSNLVALFGLAHADGARVHSNSWGDDTRTSYTTWCRDIDAFTRQNEDDLVLYAVTNLSTLRSPENAKNSLAIGATQKPPNQGSRSSGGQGPTSDGRRKPELFAPGRDTRSAGVGACANALSSGTSMACPAVAGGALLVREYFERGYYPTGSPWATNRVVPTGALVKAVLVNSSVDMPGEVGYPSDREGWGRILLDDALPFPGDARRLWLRDVRHDGGLSTGQEREWSLVVASSDQPLAITLAFTDWPASVAAELAPVNDLDLEVEGPDGLFLGNRFDPSLGHSIPGGSADPLNNVERVIRENPTPGTWTVRVRGTDVPMGPQGFAVVANGGLGGLRRVSDLAPEAETEVSAARLDPFRPNPFGGDVDLRFALPVGGNASLRIHDVTGRLVRVLLDGPVGPGEHGAVWDGRDDAGSAVSPGVYFARLTAPGVTRTVKGVHLR